MGKRYAFAAALPVVAIAATTYAQSAQASAIYYVCKAQLCRYDTAMARTRVLTRDGSARRRYSAVSVARSGGLAAFVYANRLYYARPSNLRARRVADNDVALPYVRPDGKQIAYLASRLTVQPCDYFSSFVCPPALLTPWLYTFNPESRKRNSVATSVTAAGWLRTRLMRVDDEGGRDRICVLESNSSSRCDRTVAGDPNFDLTDPDGSPNGRYVVATAIPADTDRGGRIVVTGRIALFDSVSGRLVRSLTRGSRDSSPVFSPDGRRVAFQRGRSIYVVSSNGGSARLLARDGASPSWSLR